MLRSFLRASSWLLACCSSAALALLPGACGLDDRLVTRAPERREEPVAGAAPDDDDGAAGRHDGAGGEGVVAPHLDGGAPSAEQPCHSADDCPASEVECEQPVCVRGACQTDPVKLGTRVGVDISGDCQKTVCDGDGATVTMPDDADVPDDHNECTIERCSGGEPEHANASGEIACGEGGKQRCDGTGRCACVSERDCGESKNPCATVACVSGKCEIQYVGKGQGTLPQTEQDCLQNVCSGDGNVIAQPKTTDVPVDGNPCTKDLCSDNGTPSNPPMAAKTPCGNNKSCDGLGGCSCSDPGACTGKCGQTTDACGIARDCGNPCGGFDTCGGGGKPHECGCTPIVPDCHYQLCGGLYPNGCGQNVACLHYDLCVGGSCGNCQGSCQADNTCACDAPPCS